MELIPQFNNFISDIRLSQTQRDNLKSSHRTLRERLLADEKLSAIIVSTFLQGSYRRSTATKPKNDQRADADVIVVTNLREDQYTPASALAVLTPFLEKYYKGKWRVQGRSIGIEMSNADLDVVITSAPSETERAMLKSLSVTTDEDLDQAVAEGWRLNKSWHPVGQRGLLYSESATKEEAEWKANPLRIPDRDAQRWDDTHPLEQIRWTREKNAKTDGLYVNVVKAIKWWRRINPEPKYPKGYPVEHMVGNCCPDSIRTIADGVTRTLETMAVTYAPYAQAGSVPFLPDRGVPAHNVVGRVSPVDFKNFHTKVVKAAHVARQALDCKTAKESAALWRQLFPGFPEPPQQGDEAGRGPAGGGFTPRIAPSVITDQRFG